MSSHTGPSPPHCAVLPKYFMLFALPDSTSPCLPLAPNIMYRTEHARSFPYPVLSSFSIAGTKLGGRDLAWMRQGPCPCAVHTRVVRKALSRTRCDMWCGRGCVGFCGSVEQGAITQARGSGKTYKSRDHLTELSLWRKGWALLVGRNRRSEAPGRLGRERGGSGWPWREEGESSLTSPTPTLALAFPPFCLLPSFVCSALGCSPIFSKRLPKSQLIVWPPPSAVLTATARKFSTFWA